MSEPVLDAVYSVEWEAHRIEPSASALSLLLYATTGKPLNRQAIVTLVKWFDQHHPVDTPNDLWLAPGGFAGRAWARGLCNLFNLKLG